MHQNDLQGRLDKLETLFRRAGTAGEKQAAAAAIKRLQTKRQEQPVEMKMSLGDTWSVRLFIALCRKHGIRPYRYARQRRTTVMLRVTNTVFDTVLYPEFCDLHDELATYFEETTDHLIRTVMQSDGNDDDIADDQPALTHKS